MSKDEQLYTWDEFDRDCEKIAQWAKGRGFKNIYGIPRGGLVLAVKLSNLLEIPVMLSKDDITRDTLVVDDIVDGGATIERLRNVAGSDFAIVSIFFNYKCNKAPTYFVRKKEFWVKFPWETDESSKYDYTPIS